MSVAFRELERWVKRSITFELCLPKPAKEPPRGRYLRRQGIRFLKAGRPIASSGRTARESHYPNVHETSRQIGDYIDERPRRTSACILAKVSSISRSNRRASPITSAWLSRSSLPMKSLCLSIRRRCSRRCFHPIAYLSLGDLEELAIA
jgi:hypothetical protein